MALARSTARARWALLLLTLLLALAAIAAQVPPAQAQTVGRTRLGVSGDRFTLNGTPTFLLGVSYFDARSWHTSDLDALAQRGYNLIRIWLDWRTHSFFSAQGRLTETGRSRLLSLIDAADARGMIVDVTILDVNLSFNRGYAATAVQQVASALADRRNVLYDLANEFNHHDGPFSLSELGRLATVLRSADPDAIFGVSATGGYLVRDPATVNAANVQAMLAAPLSSGVLLPHMPRTSDWALTTGPRVQALRSYLQSRGQARPIYLQEEARRGHSGLNPSRDEFLRAARAARDAGAAAWVFHTAAGFALDQQAFMAALDPVEQAVLTDLPAAVGLAPRATAPTATPAPTQPPVPTQPPAGGAAFTVGARIEAEDARSAHERGRDGNAGTAPNYPNTTGLDINRCSACSNGHSVVMKWAEWAGYPVAVARQGRYRLRLSAVTTWTDRTIIVLADGVPVTGDIPIPPSDNYHQFQMIITPPFSLPAGTRQIAVLTPKGGVLDWVQVEAAP